MLVEWIRPWFEAIDLTLPTAIRVSIGFPARRASTAIGECHAPSFSADGSTQIFISPIIGDGTRAADILVHELCHAAVGPEHGHGWQFARAGRGVALGGPLTASVAGPNLPPL